MTAALRAAVIGCGRIASTIQDEFEGRPGLQLFPYSHAGAYRACGRTELVAAADPSPERRHAFGERWGVDALYESVEDLLAHERLDVVSICVPTREHERVFDLVAREVRGVLLEKPVSITLAEADRMIERSREAGVHVAVDHTRTYDSWYRQGKRVLEDGLIGEVRTIVAFWAEGWSGGGSHLFDLLRFLTDSEPAWVFCHGDGSDAPDAGGSAYLHYRNGVRVHIEAPVGGVAPLEIDVVGTSGRLRIGTHRVQLFVNDLRLGYPVPAEWPFFARMEPVSGLEQAVHELVAAIEGGPEPSSTLEHGRGALEIAVALNRSAQTGVRVDLPIADGAAGVEAF